MKNIKGMLTNNFYSNEKSIAFKLTYSDNERTLTEKEVMDNFENIINKVTNNLNVAIQVEVIDKTE
jgi:phenylalanyl-tRNA synthetase beta subunit